MKNILILGGGGFIGKNLLNFLNNKLKTLEFNIIVMSSKPLTSHNNLTFDLKLNQIKEIKNLISDNKISIIIHLVSGLIPSSNINDFNKEIENVVEPSLKIFSYASKKGIKVIFVSSGGTVYKNSIYPHNETDNLDAISYYGQSKIMLEDSLRNLKKTANLNYVILRPSNVYGKFFNLNSNQGLIPNTINNILEKKPIVIWGDGSAKRDYLFVDDLSQSILNFIKADDINGEFNIASLSVHSVLDVVKLVEKKLNMTAQITLRDKRKIDAACSTLDISKIKETIDFYPLNLDFGLDQVIKNISF